MSQENLEIVRQVYDAAARRDAAVIFDLYDFNVELDSSRLPIAGLMGGGVHNGHDGLKRFFREWHESWSDVQYDYQCLWLRHGRLSPGRPGAADSRTAPLGRLARAGSSENLHVDASVDRR